MANEALDAVTDERPFAGVHILAAALLSAPGSTADELELARRLLLRDPKREGPRERASIAATFNRQMDTAIDSANASAGEPTRAGRRAKLAADLDRAGLVLVEQQFLGELLFRTLEDPDGESFGAELLADEVDGDGGSYTGLEFIEPGPPMIRGIEDPAGAWSVND